MTPYLLSQLNTMQTSMNHAFISYLMIWGNDLTVMVNFEKQDTNLNTVIHIHKLYLGDTIYVSE